MDKKQDFHICGGKPLQGSINISGGKNAALGIIAGSTMAKGTVFLENVPLVEDILVACEILRELGASVDLSDNGTLVIDATHVTSRPIPDRLADRMRASYYFCAALLGRFGEGIVSLPGGCAIGQRPLDQTIKGLEALGATVTIEYGTLCARAEKLRGAEIFMDCVSVGATVNTMIAAALAQGNTTIFNAAKEPHIVDVANFLTSMGARIRGAGTAIIRIVGVGSLRGTSYAVVPDQIETGTMMIAAAATRGDVLVQGVIPVHMEALSAKLLEAGVSVKEEHNALRITATQRPKAVNVTTLPYPGFPTDLQQPMGTLLTTATGTSVINETIFEQRFNYLHELSRMGARSKVVDKVALITGVESLRPARVNVPDLRAGAALVIAGLMAEGETVIGNAYYIDRGYERLAEKLCSLGADVWRGTTD